MKALLKMKAGEGNVVLKEVPKPVPGDQEVLIRVAAAGICGTDIKILHGQAWSNPPVVLGHEYSGTVEAVGKNVTSVVPGDRVVSETAQQICGTCEFCNTGHQLMCRQRLSIGYGVDGAFAEYIAVREGIVHKIPDELSFDMAALCEPFAVALHGTWDTGEILPTDKVLVMGPGTIGQLAVQAVKAKGAQVILAGTPRDRERLKIGEDLGADYTCTDISMDRIMELTNGKGVDAAVDCTGAAPAVRNAMQALKNRGRMVQIGLTSRNMEIEYGLLTQKEISIIGSFGHQWHNWEQAISLMASGKARIGELITGRYELEEWETAFEEMENQKGIKILIYPNGREKKT
ncbi:zinc-binding dehydrogenase [Clostridium sp. AM58-1XD]|uniref:zinc-dependent alcohol dehydrogenase n=1 Tax=Clostridium sp. AM58-1XD TaxID=2292307 RepID=UPI0015F5A23D|nr:zinc-binding dehydrogenase [Clostridium sp. AM58-1XD]